MICIFSGASAFATPYTFAHKYFDNPATPADEGDHSFYKWEPGPDSALTFPETDPPPGTPGGATWSIMPAGFLYPMGDSALHPDFAESQDFLSLVDASGTSFPDGNISSHFPAGEITAGQAGFWPGLNPGDPVPYELWAVDWSLDEWAAVSGFENLGPVKDGALIPDDESARDPGFPDDDWNGNRAQNANGGNLGDIRVAAYPTEEPYLGHSIPPSTETDSSQPFQGLWETWGGDTHMATERPGDPGPSNPSPLTWVDNESDISGNFQYDLLTVVLHEMGHALGLGHPDGPDTNSYNVMTPYSDRGEALRVLQDGDIAGIQALYGPAGDIPDDVPEPATLLLVGTGLAGMVAFRRKMRK